MLKDLITAAAITASSALSLLANTLDGLVGRGKYVAGAIGTSS